MLEHVHSRAAHHRGHAEGCTERGVVVTPGAPKVHLQSWDGMLLSSKVLDAFSFGPMLSSECVYAKHSQDNTLMVSATATLNRAILVDDVSLDRKRLAERVPTASR